MKWFLYNISLAFIGIWPVKHFFKPELDKPLVFLGYFILIFLALWLFTFFINRKYFYIFPKMLNFTLFFFKETIKANLRVAHDIITPKFYMKPAIIAIPLEVKTDFEIVTLASVITLTPGTLSIDISEDRKTLYVHEMYVVNGDVEKAKKNIKDGFEKKILELTR